MSAGTSLLGVKLKKVGAHMIVYGFGSVARKLGFFQGHFCWNEELWINYE